MKYGKIPLIRITILLKKNRSFMSIYHPLRDVPEAPFLYIAPACWDQLSEFLFPSQAGGFKKRDLSV
jgi:hypothetical protein